MILKPDHSAGMNHLGLQNTDAAEVIRSAALVVLAWIGEELAAGRPFGGM